MKQPNPKVHFYISLAKSILRVAAGLSLYKGVFTIAGILFITAEVLGILEEVF